SSSLPSHLVQRHAATGPSAPSTTLLLPGASGRASTAASALAGTGPGRRADQVGAQREAAPGGLGGLPRVVSLPTGSGRSPLPWLARALDWVRFWGRPRLRQSRCLDQERLSIQL